MEVDDSVAFERLVSVVEANRATVAVVFPAVGAVLMVASQRFDHVLLEAARESTVGLVLANAVMALPLALAVLPAVDSRALLGLGVVSVLAYVFESVGVATGVPYGDFSYLQEMGPMAFGVPVALPLFWVPILLNGYLLSLRYVRPHVGRAGFVVAAVGFVVGLDGVLDPGAVALGFWGWNEPGVYYGVPLVNYLGWILSGSMGVAVLAVSFDDGALDERVRGFAPAFDTLVAFLVFWGLVALFHGLWLPLLGAAALGVLLLSTEEGRYLPT
ncbi:MAG: bisanhydrobacterioruberin hydratase CruF [Halobacteriota archaeon]